MEKRKAIDEFSIALMSYALGESSSTQVAYEISSVADDLPSDLSLMCHRLVELLEKDEGDFSEIFCLVVEICFLVEKYDPLAAKHLLSLVSSFEKISSDWKENWAQ